MRGPGAVPGVAPLAVAAAMLALAGCSAEPAGDPGPARRPVEQQSVATPSPTPSPAPSPTASATPEQPPAVRPDDLDVSIAVAAVRHLAGDIGPRHATSPEFRRAARWVAGRLQALGYDVRRQPVDVPGGTSWGVPVRPGRSLNVVAAPQGLRPGDPHLVVGAHLDTVPQAPGAEDNASGVGVLLAAAAAMADARARLPVVFVAFGAEEPRGATDDDHHYGSRAYVAALGAAARRSVAGMVSLDRVGVGSAVPVSAAHDGPDPTVRRLHRLADLAGIPVAVGVNRSSDHWSFVRAGLPGVRLGSTPYAAYHSAADRPAVVDRAQLDRTGRLLLAWLAPE